MTDASHDAVYLWAAAHGHSEAQAALVHACLGMSEKVKATNPILAGEYLASAELMAQLVSYRDGGAYGSAVLAAVFAVRSIYCAESDPVRSLDYRESANALFAEVEQGSDAHALGIVAYALNRLADAGDADAADALNRVVDRLPASEAVALREAMRSETCEVSR